MRENLTRKLVSSVSSQKLFEASRINFFSISSAGEDGDDELDDEEDDNDYDENLSVESSDESSATDSSDTEASEEVHGTPERK